MNVAGEPTSPQNSGKWPPWMPTTSVKYPAEARAAMRQNSYGSSRGNSLSDSELERFQMIFDIAMHAFEQAQNKFCLDSGSNKDLIMSKAFFNRNNYVPQDNRFLGTALRRVV